MYYCAYVDDDDDLIVSFGTEEEIADDALCGEGITPDVHEELGNKIGDTGELCEDYLMSPTWDKNDLKGLKAVIESYGFKENLNLKGCGWG